MLFKKSSRYNDGVLIAEVNSFSFTAVRSRTQGVPQPGITQ